MSYIDCPKCNGTGKVDGPWYSFLLTGNGPNWATCKRCEGSGTVESEDHIPYDHTICSHCGKHYWNGYDKCPHCHW